MFKGYKDLNEWDKKLLHRITDISIEDRTFPFELIDQVLPVALKATMTRGIC